MRAKKLTKQLIETLEKLDGILDNLHEENVHVSLFHLKGSHNHKSSFGLYSDSVSDRIKLGSVIKSDTLYDYKSIINKIEEDNNDNTNQN